MITRFIIASLLTVGTLSGVAWQRAGVRDDVRSGLLLFTDPEHCQPCRDFDRDYATVPGLRQQLTGTFRCYKAYHQSKHPGQFKAWNITRLPTFIIIDGAGTELHRVTGYSGPAHLMQELTTTRDNGICRPIGNTFPRQPPASSSPASEQRQSPDQSRIIADLKAANQRLEQLRDNLEANQKHLERRILEAEEQAKRDCRELTDQQRIEFAAAQQRLQLQVDNLKASEARCRAEAEEYRKRLSQPSAPDWLVPATAAESNKPPPDISPEIRPPRAIAPAADTKSNTDTVPDLARHWGGLFGSLAVGAVKLAKPEFAIPISLAAGGIAWLRKRKAGPASAEPFPETSDTPAKPATIPATSSADDSARMNPEDARQRADNDTNFDLPTLPFQDVDYTTTWADHWVREGKSPELAAQEYSHFVNAFGALAKGELKLPGIEDGPLFAKQVRNWVARQFRAYTSKQVDTNNPNHRAFYAFLHKQAFENIRNGRFNEAAPNPKAADVLEDWVNERVVGSIVFNTPTT